MWMVFGPSGQSAAVFCVNRINMSWASPWVLAMPQASPLVIWEGSHRIIRAAFKSVLDHLPVEQWGSVDLTEVYHQAPQRLF
jgi:hypothetical protein